jgi:hypothetical protein
VRPRGLPSRWRRVSATYAYEAKEPSRAAELAAAVAFEEAAERDGQARAADELTALTGELGLYDRPPAHEG